MSIVRLYSTSYVDKFIRTDNTNLEFQKFFPKKVGKDEIALINKKNVVRVFLRVLLYYGFKLKNFELIRIENNNNLYSETNYKKWIYMMNFLTKVGLGILSALFMLAICYYMKENEAFNKKLRKSRQFPYLLQTQPYLREPKNLKKFLLENTGNSCYLDSVLVPLFIEPIPFIQENILNKNIREIKSPHCSYTNLENIQKELVRINESISGKGNIKVCTTLRRYMKSCPSTSGENFYDTGPHDSGEFLQYLFTLFDVNGRTYSKTTIITNDLSPVPKKYIVSSNITITASPVILIQPFQLIDKESVNLSDMIEQKEDAIFDRENLYRYQGNLYKRRIEKIETTEAEFLVFYPSRKYINEHRREKRLYTEIIPDKHILGLNLFCIVVHMAGHYTAYLNYGGYWYYYDDLRSSLKYVGTYQELLDIPSGEKNPFTHGNLYMYR